MSNRVFRESLSRLVWSESIAVRFGMSFVVSLRKDIDEAAAAVAVNCGLIRK